MRTILCKKISDLPALQISDPYGYRITLNVVKHELSIYMLQCFGNAPSRTFDIYSLSSDFAHINLIASGFSSQYALVAPLANNQHIAIDGLAKSQDHQNAIVLAEDGTVITSFHAGDGIADLVSCGDGKIWLAYTEQGVYSSSSPLGQNGILGLDEQGGVVFSYFEVAKRNELQMFDDLYALNIADDGSILAYFYGHFTLVRIFNDYVTSQWYSTIPKGAQAIARSESHYLFVSSYRDTTPSILATSDMSSMEDVIFSDESGHNIAKQVA